MIFIWKTPATNSHVTFTWKSPVTITNEIPCGFHLEISLGNFLRLSQVKPLLTVRSEISSAFHLEISRDFHKWNFLWLSPVTSPATFTPGQSSKCKDPNFNVRVQITQVKASKCKYPSVSIQVAWLHVLREGSCGPALVDMLWRG